MKLVYEYLKFCPLQRSASHKYNEFYHYYFNKLFTSFNFRTQPQDTACQAMIDKRCAWTKGKVLGGSSVLNTMLYIRGNKRDYDQWESFGNPGWGYEDVLPYFKKSQDQRNPYLARDKRHHATGK